MMARLELVALVKATPAGFARLYTALTGKEATEKEMSLLIEIERRKLQEPEP